mgnify:CR=1 FL=1
MSMGKILVADDDQNIAELLRLYLEKEGYTVVLAADGEQAIERFNAENPDIVLLDIMMPKLDGWQVCRDIRKKSNCPIIMVTAKGETFDKVLGLELGADDYVVKPFDAKEIVARIKAVMRRTGKASAGSDVKEVSYDKLVVNMTKYELKVDGKVIDTPPKELELLYHLASNPNRVYTRDQLLNEVWGFEIVAVYPQDYEIYLVHFCCLAIKFYSGSCLFPIFFRSSGDCGIFRPPSSGCFCEESLFA